jgi:hypothetical protein
MSIEDIPMATQEDLAAIDRLIKPQEPPERIYGWLHTQMSIARYWGGLTYMGQSYIVAPHEKGAPLVRADVLQREAKAKADQAKAVDLAAKLAAKQAQGVLL